MTAPRDVARLGADQLAWRELLHDELRSLRRWTAMLAAVAMVALGIAVVALLTGDSGGERRGSASAERVAALERKLDDIHETFERTPLSGAVASVQARQRAIERELAE